MIRYQTSLKNNPPPVNQIASQAREAFAQSPYAGQNHQDVFRGMGQMQSVDMDRYAQQVSDDYQNQRQEAERGLALAGLNQMGQAQQNQMSLQNQRMQMLLNNLL